MANRVLVLGARGMLGHVAMKSFRENGDDVLGIAMEGPAPDVYVMDAASPALDRFLYINKFDVVVNCIGILNRQAEANPDLAVYLNGYLPHKLEQFYRNTGTKIIQPSTDCVFAGNTGPYDERSAPDGQTFYDRSKAIGEIANDKDLTMRMSIIGPDTNAGGIGLFNWFMRQSGRVSGYTNAVWTGITTVQLAKGMIDAVRQGVTGLYHYVPDCSISKYGLLKIFAEVFERSDIEIVPVEEPRVDKSLVNTRVDFDHKIPDYRTMVEEMKCWMERNRELYPHYGRF